MNIHEDYQSMMEKYPSQVLRVYHSRFVIKELEYEALNNQGKDTDAIQSARQGMEDAANAYMALRESVIGFHAAQ